MVGNYIILNILVAACYTGVSAAHSYGRDRMTLSTMKINNFIGSCDDNSTKGNLLRHGPLTRYTELRDAHVPGMPGTFSPTPTSKETASYRSRHASRHVCQAHAVMNVGIANPRWRGKTFPAFPVHAQPAILRIWQEAHVSITYSMKRTGSYRVALTLESHGADVRMRYVLPTGRISHTVKTLIYAAKKSQNLNVSRLVLQLSLPNPLKPGVKSWMKI